MNASNNGVVASDRFTGPDPGGDGFFDAFLSLLATRAEESLTVALAAQAWAREKGDEAGVARAQLGEAMARDALGQPERDIVLARALTLAQRLGEPVLLLRATNVQVVVDIYKGRFADALTKGQAVLGLAHALQRPDLLGRLLNNVANALVNIGEYAMSIALYKEWRQLLIGHSDETKLNRVRASNNEAVAWWRLARTYDPCVAKTQVMEALDRARQLAEQALSELLQGDYGIHRLNSLDTLVSVLLEQGQHAQAMTWVRRVADASGDLLAPNSLYWGMYAMALSRVELALPTPDLPAVLERLKAVEALPGPRFRGGEMQATLHACLADVHERLGGYRDALAYDRQALRFEARSQSLWAREHAISVHHTLDSLRGETEEFITHDLRNPLGAALVQMEAVACSAALEPSGRDLLAVAQEHVQNAVDAADFHLTIVRVRNLRRAGLALLDPAELLDDVAERLAPPAGAGTRLEREVEWGLAIRGDRISLLSAMDCLLRLALSHCPQGDAVHCRLDRVPDYARLTIDVPASGWTQGLSASLQPRPRAPHSHVDMASTMITRVAQLHDSRIEVRATSTGARRVCVDWHLPLTNNS